MPCDDLSDRFEGSSRYLIKQDNQQYSGDEKHEVPPSQDWVSMKRNAKRGEREHARNELATPHMHAAGRTQNVSDKYALALSNDHL
ncbi:MAG: hypothetical protein C5B55_09455 [Blastocatellia bacterium]|nr:MAG: hypothetical protein C5B55_09455 [Blastocatellia bacterium]